MHRVSLAVLLLVGLLLAGNNLLAQEPDAPIEEGVPLEVAQPEIPAELQDSAFDQYVDLEFLREAWASLDPPALADAGLQLAEGERVLLRSHRVASAATILGMAIKVASEQHDIATLNRLSKATSALGKREFTSRIALAVKLASQPRAAQPSVNISLNEVTATDLSLYRIFLDRISQARIRDDRARLQTLEKDIATDDSLPDVLQKELSQSLADAKRNTATANERHRLLDRLSATSRVTLLEVTTAPSVASTTMAAVLSYTSLSRNTSSSYRFTNRSKEYLSFQYFVYPDGRYGGTLHFEPGKSRSISLSARAIVMKVKSFYSPGRTISHYVVPGNWESRDQTYSDRKLYRVGP